jgi:hypothetical protein
MKGAQPMADTEPLWTAKQTAQFLGVTDDALYRMRLNGAGPKFLIVTGREKYRYRPSAVRQWVEESETPSMAAFHENQMKRALTVARQRESLAHARESRWKPKHRFDEVEQRRKDIEGGR